MPSIVSTRLTAAETSMALPFRAAFSSSFATSRQGGLLTIRSGQMMFDKVPNIRERALIVLEF
jgi:hypothetical protein